MVSGLILFTVTDFSHCLGSYPSVSTARESGSGSIMSGVNPACYPVFSLPVAHRLGRESSHFLSRCSSISDRAAAWVKKSQRLSAHALATPFVIPAASPVGSFRRVSHRETRSAGQQVPERAAEKCSRSSRRKFWLKIPPQWYSVRV
jgi:hypothetical protein